MLKMRIHQRCVDSAAWVHSSAASPRLTCCQLALPLGHSMLFLSHGRSSVSLSMKSAIFAKSPLCFCKPLSRARRSCPAMLCPLEKVITKVPVAQSSLKSTTTTKYRDIHIHTYMYMEIFCFFKINHTWKIKEKCSLQDKDIKQYIFS